MPGVALSQGPLAIMGLDCAAIFSPLFVLRGQSEETVHIVR